MGYAHEKLMMNAAKIHNMAALTSYGAELKITQD